MEKVTNTTENAMDPELHIDPETCTPEELEKELTRLRSVSSFYSDLEQSTKKFINSIYGATGNKGFEWADTKVSKSITLQGRQLTRYGSMLINTYFRTEFKTNTELHKKLGISTEKARRLDVFGDQLENDDVRQSYIGKQYQGVDVTPVHPMVVKGGGDKRTLEIASDTDSIYAQMGPITDYFGIKGDREQINFLITLYKESLMNYLDKGFTAYAMGFNCKKNLENFELEKISRNVVLVCKKHYVMNIGFYEPDVFYDYGERMLYKGLKVVQGSTPAFMRTHLKEMTEWVIKRHTEGTLKMSDLIFKLNEIKQLMKYKDPDEICPNITMNNLEKMVLSSDPKALEVTFAKGCQPYHRGAAYYNLILRSKTEYAMKYEPLKSGEKVKYYKPNLDVASKVWDNANVDCFSYRMGEFPEEFAPPIDFDSLFVDQFLKEINRIIEAIGYKAVPERVIKCINGRNFTTLF